MERLKHAKHVSEKKDDTGNAKTRNCKKQTMTLKEKSKMPGHKNADRGQTYRQF